MEREKRVYDHNGQALVVEDNKIITSNKDELSTDFNYAIIDRVNFTGAEIFTMHINYDNADADIRLNPNVILAAKAFNKTAEQFDDEKYYTHSGAIIDMSKIKDLEKPTDFLHRNQTIVNFGSEDCKLAITRKSTANDFLVRYSNYLTKENAKLEAAADDEMTK